MMDVSPPVAQAPAAAQHRAAARARFVAAAIGGATATLALAGWLLDVDVLSTVVPGWASQKVNTAIAFAALSLALCWPRQREALALVAGALAWASAWESLVGVELGIDEWWIADPASVAVGEPAGRMSLATALGLTLLSGSLLVRRVDVRAAHGLGASALGVAWVGAIGHVYALGPLTGVPGFGTLSLPTIVTLVAVGLGTLLLDPGEGITPAFCGADAGAWVLRRMTPAVLLAPAIAMWPAVTVPIESRSFAAAAGVTGLVSLFLGLLASVAGQLRRAERSVQQLTQKLVDAGEDERRAIAREVHDQLGQTVSTVGLLLSRGGMDAVGEAKALVDELGHVLRDVARELRPAALDDLGLGPAVRGLADRMARAADLGFDVQVRGEARVEPALETAGYRIVQEALTNVVRHAGARHVWVDVEVGSAGLRVAVRDDGVGFDPRSVPPDRSGISGMRERARLLGGSFEIVSSATAGTEVVAWLPR